MIAAIVGFLVACAISVLLSFAYGALGVDADTHAVLSLLTGVFFGSTLPILAVEWWDSRH